MIAEHILWWLLTMTCVFWYCTICVYVAVKGASDIRTMLACLRDSPNDSPGTPDETPTQEHRPHS